MLSESAITTSFFWKADNLRIFPENCSICTKQRNKKNRQVIKIPQITCHGQICNHLIFQSTQSQPDKHQNIHQAKTVQHRFLNNPLIQRIPPQDK
ncbi:hypothetical protein COPCOM_01717 [Coprococcus comes ATCC 27758]|uniref:Uncharacterized protein n=1 Tax=Coprococcus comes ATCC 27758 TaxID=470146 RepID=C0B991_9FIRM|nr:hypothetical protein COPCOM_01717 [Coprococcus comes ATCC 27758]